VTYRIGKAQDPRDSDPLFTDWKRAIAAALDMSTGTIIAIRDTTGSVLALVYQGCVYM